MTYNKYIFIYINLRFVGGGSRHFVLSHDLARKYSAIIDRYRKSPRCYECLNILNK